MLCAVSAVWENLNQVEVSIMDWSAEKFRLEANWTPVGGAEEDMNPKFGYIIHYGGMSCFKKWFSQWKLDYMMLSNSR